MTTMQIVSGKQAPDGATRRATSLATQEHFTSTVAVSLGLLWDLVEAVAEIKEQIGSFERELIALGDRIEDTRDRQKRDLDRLARDVQGLTRAVADVRAVQADAFRNRGPR